jgi:hypothetical protein
MMPTQQMGDAMRSFGWTVAASVLYLVAAAGCTDPSQKVMNKEDLLIASGFKFVPANTPQRQMAFRQLTPHKFVRQVRGDKVIYVYPDPTICVCLYVGGPKAYAAYRSRVFDKQIADEQQMTADTYSMASWDWSPWAYGYPDGWPWVDSIYNY